MSHPHENKVFTKDSTVGSKGKFLVNEVFVADHQAEQDVQSEQGDGHLEQIMFRK